MACGQFDGDGFFAALDGQRVARRLNWKQVSEQSGVSPSTLTRLSQGKKPDVDSLSALISWLGMGINNFIISSSTNVSAPSSLAQISAFFRADPNLSPESAKALEVLVKTAYDNLRRD